MTGEGPLRRSGSFHGRRKGKMLRPAQAGRFVELLPVLRLDLSGPPPADARSLFQPARDGIASVRLEIGFGGAEHLLHQAARHPDVGFVGVEPFVNGMAKALAGIERLNLANVRLFDNDAALLLDWLPPASVAHVDLLYPDPWPKIRHWKRRFVSDDNLGRLARVIAPGGVFRFATDIDTYVEWTLAHMRRTPAFRWTAERADDWRQPWPDWPGTRYEAKAFREGRRPTYLQFTRL